MAYQDVAAQSNSNADVFHDSEVIKNIIDLEKKVKSVS